MRISVFYLKQKSTQQLQFVKNYHQIQYSPNLQDSQDYTRFSAERETAANCCNDVHLVGNERNSTVVSRSPNVKLSSMTGQTNLTVWSNGPHGRVAVARDCESVDWVAICKCRLNWQVDSIRRKGTLRVM